VRYGVISDIHGNLVALERVLEVLNERDVGRYLCLGDIVGYGARPNECCDLVRELDGVSVVGNHDAAACRPGKERWFTPAARACILWTREVLTETNREFLSSLQTRATVGGAELCHGSLADPEAYVTMPVETLSSFALMEEQVCFFGHTHYAEWFVQSEAERLPVQLSASAGGRFELVPEHKYMVNPGAVGQPRDRNSQASFAIYDAEAGTVEIVRVGYDVATTQRQIIAAGLPENMAARLLMGV